MTRGGRRWCAALALSGICLGVPATALGLALDTSGGSGLSVAQHSRSSGGIPQVGTLYGAGASAHSCTAGVIDSPLGNTLITAAHCVSGTGQGMTFVPEAQGTSAPLGRWRVVAAHVTSDWIGDQSPREDVAFLTVAPITVEGHTRTLQQVTGGLRLGSGARVDEQVRVTGYVAGQDDDAITCLARVYRDEGYPAFDCSGYADGTSGSPWVLDARGGPEVVGVIGGLHQGGCEPSTSYSPLFTEDVYAAFRLAERGIDPSTVPGAHGDGC